MFELGVGISGDGRSIPHRAGPCPGNAIRTDGSVDARLCIVPYYVVSVIVIMIICYVVLCNRMHESM